jgi:hypothetical protein
MSQLRGSTKRIFIAGPYTTGDPAVNVKAALDAATPLLNAGAMPYVPHLNHFWHFVYPQDYEVWVDLDLEFLAACDALLRLPGESPGADGEVARARELGIPVFDNLAQALEWAWASPRDPFEYSRELKPFSRSREEMDAAETARDKRMHHEPHYADLQRHLAKVDAARKARRDAALRRSELTGQASYDVDVSDAPSREELLPCVRPSDICESNPFRPHRWRLHSGNTCVYCRRRILPDIKRAA